MKINFISFLDPLVYSGGGEMVNRQLVNEGLRREHQISFSAVRPGKMNFQADADLNILADIFNMGHSYQSLIAWRGFSDKFLSHVIQKTPFVQMTNAYADFCNLPFLPCNGKAEGSCPEKPSLSAARRFFMRDWGNDCFAKKELVRNLYTKSSLNIFMSPAHRDITESFIGKDRLPDSYVVRPMIDTNTFFNRHQERDIDYLFVGVVGRAKGFYQMRKEYFDKNIHFVGKCMPDIKVDFGTYVGHLPYDQIPLYMNRAKNFVFLPEWREPQPRVIAEAALCGCKIIANENAGVMTFDGDLSSPSFYDNIAGDFWNRLEVLSSSQQKRVT